MMMNGWAICIIIDLIQYCVIINFLGIINFNDLCKLLLNYVVNVALKKNKVIFVKTGNIFPL